MALYYVHSFYLPSDYGLIIISKVIHLIAAFPHLMQYRNFFKKETSGS